MTYRIACTAAVLLWVAVPANASAQCRTDDDSYNKYVQKSSSANGEGIDSGFELLAGVSGPPSGFGFLLAFDGFATPKDLDAAASRNGDGAITPADAIYHRLLLWTDRNHNGLSEEEELQSLAHAGIRAIYLAITRLAHDTTEGNVLQDRSDALRANAAGVDVLRHVTSVRLARSGN